MAQDGTFLMNCWYVAAWVHELIDGRLLKMHPIASDAALAHFRRTLERMIETERPGLRTAAA